MNSPDVDHRPSPTLVVAGILARSGWAPEPDPGAGPTGPVQADPGCRARRRLALWLSAVAAFAWLAAALVWTLGAPHPETISLVLMGIAVLCLATATVEARTLHTPTRASDRPSRLP